MSSNFLDVNSSSSSSSTPAAAEQLCYIPCSFCNIILAVSVPCSSLFEIVTVRCGHCGNLWSVNMAAALHSLSASWQQQQQQQQQQLHRKLHAGLCGRQLTPVPTICNKFGNAGTMRVPMVGRGNEERAPINRPPEKKQRVPSVYNQFIKEEIQRIKANNPEITHREAFSTAAKNWAHFPTFSSD
ncbi:unnamed protein product [Spirodela intermedia]|uniref:Uncharacterized protein n=1 Tax=Spirodela intermedia TaxID=51605 RepID=A0A7I8J8I4_SPIIN|nr:unnamed protein product [Spirodela intermedia]CAA6666399.1 unnamed protein product [Spirodela intermedia]